MSGAGINLPIVTWDAETFYDPKQGYTLSSMSTAGYIRDSRFRLLGFGLQVGAGVARYFHGDALLRDPAFRARLEGSVILAHNAAFDLAILNWHYDIRPKGILDTLSMARALGLSELAGGLSLAKLCRYFGLGEKAPLTPDSTPEELALRGAIDATLTYKLLGKLLPGYPQPELKLIDMTIRQFTEPTIMADVPRLETLEKSLREGKAAALAALNVDEATLASPAMFAGLLEGLGCPVPMKQSPSGKNEIPALAKTDQGMKDLLEHDDLRVAALAAARLQVKATGDETRARRFIDMARHGALPVWYNYWGAHPGRWSGGDKTNFANLRRGGALRDALLAPEGQVFVAGDLAQIQARLVAVLAGETELVEQFREGRDVYCDFGTYLFNRTITKDDEYERFCCKFWILGGGFGMGAAKGALQMRAEINKRGLPFTPPDLAMTKTLVDAYRGRYRGVPELWRRAEHLLGNPGAVLGPVVSEGNAILLPNGMRLRYPGLRQEHYEMSGEQKHGWRYDGRTGRTATWGGAITENIVMGLERCLLGDAMIRLLPFWKLPMHTYDEVAILAKLEQIESARSALQFALTRVPDWMPTLPLAVEIGAHRSYGKC